MHRFFLSPPSIQSGSISFPPDLAHQIASVLRLHPGESVMVLDGRGHEYEVELTLVERGQASGRVLSQRATASEPPIRLTLYLALSRREKFEWMLQKCTEVGASAFVPVITSRTLVQDERDPAKKLERWERILREAAEQSHRGRIPELHPPLRFEAALQAAARHPLRLIPWEGEQSVTLRQALRSYPHPLREGPGVGPGQEIGTAAVFIGPEGGFSEDEILLARQSGFQPITLGPRILRMETAAVVAAALLIYEIENSQQRTVNSQ